MERIKTVEFKAKVKEKIEKWNEKATVIDF